MHIFGGINLKEVKDDPASKEKPFATRKKGKEVVGWNKGAQVNEYGDDKDQIVEWDESLFTEEFQGNELRELQEADDVFAATN